jgi:hypothetical protein
MYAEFLHDPKVRTMSDENQLRLVLLLCLRCNGSVTLQDNHVTFALRISSIEWCDTKAVFIDAGFIDSDNNVLNWDKRQYVSDTSAARVAKHRELHKTVTRKPCNVTVTSPEQNRTDTEQNIKTSSASDDAGVEYSKAFISFWEMYPLKKNKGLAYKSFKKIKPAEYPAIKAGLLVAQKSDSWIKDNGQYIPHPSSWLNARGWEDEQSGQTGTGMEAFMRKVGAIPT